MERFELKNLVDEMRNDKDRLEILKEELFQPSSNQFALTYLPILIGIGLDNDYLNEYMDYHFPIIENTILPKPNYSETELEKVLDFFIEYDCNNYKIKNFLIIEIIGRISSIRGYVWQYMGSLMDKRLDYGDVSPLPRYYNILITYDLISENNLSTFLYKHGKSLKENHFRKLLICVYESSHIPDTLKETYADIIEKSYNRQLLLGNFNG